jgi:hypothetical protein
VNDANGVTAHDSKISCAGPAAGGRSLPVVSRHTPSEGAAGCVASLSAVLVLAAVAVVAQEKKDPPKPGHEGTAKSGAAKSDAAVIAKTTSAAPPDIGRNATGMGAGADGKMTELRAGPNGWMCMLDLAGDAMCLDKEWQAWGDAWMNKKEPPKRKTVGVAYMLKGDNQWVVSGSHIMILPTDLGELDAYPTDWTKGGP